MARIAEESSAKKGNLLATLEIDSRLLGMIGAFVALCLGFHLATGGLFLTPRNVFNLTVQTVSVAIMAMGMVFIIVMRHIDLSVGALLCTISAVMAMLQTAILPQIFGIGHPLIAPLAIVSGVAVGAAIGAFQGWLVGYLVIPSFIVTLGGLLIWRNVGWFLTNGQTIGPLDQNFLVLGGTGGTAGETASLILGGLAVLAALWAQWAARGAKQGHGFTVKPIWAEAVLGLIVIVLIMGFVLLLNAAEVPKGALERAFAARGEVMPEGFTKGYGIPFSVLLLIVLAIGMTVIATRTRFGRYIYATGGNPDAASLSGINTRLLTVKVFALMGALTAISAVVASARLTFHPNDIGTLDELRVIAAAVIGGTALAGGVGTIWGAILGALIMQSLQSGMAMMNVDTPYQNIVVGLVLVVAVWVDIIYRKRVGART